MKNILHSADALKIIKRVNLLSGASYCRWGSLSVGEMIYHTTCVNEAILTAPPSTHSPSLKQRMLRILVLDLLQKLPMGIKGNPKFFSDDQTLFTESGKQNLLLSIAAFSNSELSLGGEHPVFGKLSHRNWGRFVWIHLDHHLRQFGV